MARETLLVQTFVELIDGLTTDIDVVDHLTRLSERSVELLAIDEAGVLLADGHGALRVLAASSDVTDLLELFEGQQAQGPALDSYLTGRPILDQDLGSENTLRRWPGLTHRARDLGFSLVNALPLGVQDRRLGSFCLLARSSTPLGAADHQVARALADVAAISIVHTRAVREAEVLAERLQSAVQSRAVIEQAKGILAERAGIGMAEAFAVLRRYSRWHSRPLSLVASEVVAGAIAPAEVTAGAPGSADRQG